MNTKEDFVSLLERFNNDAPTDALSLRRASAKIISQWIKSGFPYPDKKIDGFIYIESSIEDSLEERTDDPVSVEREIAEAYNFHIKSFLELITGLLKELRHLKVGGRNT